MSLLRPGRAAFHLACLLAVSLHATNAASQSAPVEPSLSAPSASGSPDLSTARDIQGMSVWDHKNELLGEVDDVILDRSTSKLRLVVISQGGFLGIGGKEVAIEWAEIDYDPQARLLRTHRLTAEDLEERAPYRSDKAGVSIDDVQ